MYQDLSCIVIANRTKKYSLFKLSLTYKILATFLFNFRFDDPTCLATART